MLAEAAEVFRRLLEEVTGLTEEAVDGRSSSALERTPKMIENCGNGSLVEVEEAFRNLLEEADEFLEEPKVRS